MTNHADLQVLIADDHFLIRQFIRRVLLENGFTHVDMVNDGNEAVESINTSLASDKKPYDIVLLDWNMPTLSGIDVLAYIRSKQHYNNSAVVMFTAESERTNIMKAVKMGATSYILKPISPVDLNKKIREIVEWLKTRNVVAV